MKKQQADFNARSKQNGIIFYSNTLPSIGLQTFFDNSGNIRSQLVPKTLDKIFDFLEAENYKILTPTDLFKVKNIEKIPLDRQITRV